MITFQKWLQEKRIKLKPWQMKAAMAFLTLMRPHKSPGTGKSYLSQVLKAFVDECGNRFMLEEEETDDRKRRGHDKNEDRLPGGM